MPTEIYGCRNPDHNDFFPDCLICDMERVRQQARKEAFKEAAMIVAGWPWARIALVGFPELKAMALKIMAEGEEKF